MAPDEVALYIHQVTHSYVPFTVMGCLFSASSEWYATRSSLPSTANSWTEVWHGSNKTNRSECCWSINNQQSGVWSLSSVLVDSLLSGKEIMKYYKKYHFIPLVRAIVKFYFLLLCCKLFHSPYFKFINQMINKHLPVIKENGHSQRFAIIAKLGLWIQVLSRQDFLKEQYFIVLFVDIPDPRPSHGSVRPSWHFTGRSVRFCSCRPFSWVLESW